MSDPFLDALNAQAGAVAPSAPSGVPRSVRNNNPGNIVFDPNNKWQGQTGSDGKFAIFDSPESGDRAHAKVLENYQKLHGINTIRGAISRFAPPSDGNDTNAYIDTVSKQLGVGPDDKVDLSDPRINSALRQAQQPIEAGTGGLGAAPAPKDDPFLSALDNQANTADDGEAGFRRTADGRLEVDITPNDAPNPNQPQTTSQGLGFYQGLMRPIDNAAHWVDSGAKKMGVDTDAISHALGMPTTDEANAGHKNYIRGEEWKGVAPGKVGEFAGSVAGTSAALLATRNPFLAGAASGALDTQHPDDLAQVGKDALIGAAVGKAADVGVGAVSGVVSPKIAATARLLADRGVPLTPGQILGGTAKRTEDALTSVPFVGDLIKNAQGRSVEGANRAALNEALSPIGQTLPASVNVGRDAAAHAQKVASQAYEDSLSAMRIAPEPQLVQDLTAAQSIAAKLPPAQKTTFKAIMDRDVAPFMQGGAMDGKQLQAFKRGIDQRIASFSKQSATPADELTIEPLNAVRDAVMSAADRQNPELFKGYQAADQAFARVQRINEATAKARSDKAFTPNAFAQSVAKRGYGTTTAKVAAGDAKMQKLADAMMEVLPSSVPDSGTPLRSAIIGGGGLAAAGQAGLLSAALLKAAPAAIPLAAYTKLGQKLVQAGLLKRPPGAKELAKALAHLKTPAVIAGSQLAVTRAEAGSDDLPKPK